MVDVLMQLISWILMIAGCVFVVSGAAGLVRLPDLYTRLHAASLTDTGGTLFIGLALIIQAVFIFDNPMAAIKMAMIIFFTLFTAPTASHVLAKTALLCGHVPVSKDGNPLVDSEAEATQLARSRPADYRHGQDAEQIAREFEKFNNKRGGMS